MLPGDFIAYKLTGEINTTRNGLSEGIIWDYKNDKTADWLLDFYGIDSKLTPKIVDNFSKQGTINSISSKATGLNVGVPITYRAGDQPNNALSLNVFDDGEVAASGGTSGVIYSITENLSSKEPSRINHFAHVNYSDSNKSIGKLLCINGAGIQYRWLRNHSVGDSYEKMNKLASEISVGSDGISVIPFGNGAERMLNNMNIGTHICNINLNQHSHGHLYRSSLEGIAFSFMYGMEILKNDNAQINVIRAGNDNLFRSEIFSSTVATLIGHEIEIYNTTGAFGAARASGILNDDFSSFREKITKNDHVMTFLPITGNSEYIDAYARWKEDLNKILKNK
jgi:xylulokinase